MDKMTGLCAVCPAAHFPHAGVSQASPEEITQGECRLKPPVNHLVGMQQSVSGPVPMFRPLFPAIHAGHWCMEHPDRAKRMEPLTMDRMTAEFQRIPTLNEVRKYEVSNDADDTPMAPTHPPIYPPM